MQGKKYEITTDWPDGEDCLETRYFNAQLSDEEIREIIHPSDMTLYAPKNIEYAGVVDLAETLGEDFREWENRYYTLEEWKFVVADAMEGVCPGGQGYDK